MNKNKRCILIADDEPKMVRALRDFFRASKFCVLEAGDGMEALDIFYENSHVIDIILLDVMMPRKDGLATLKQIREASFLTPSILLTAKGEEYDQLSGKELELTRREYDLLYYLAVNSSLALSREQLLDYVWGYDFEGGYRTMDTHIRQFRGKLGACADYISNVWQEKSVCHM